MTVRNEGALEGNAMVKASGGAGEESKGQKAILPVLSSPTSRKRSVDTATPHVSVLVQGRFGELLLRFSLFELSFLSKHRVELKEIATVHYDTDSSARTREFRRGGMIWATPLTSLKAFKNSS